MHVNFVIAWGQIYPMGNLIPDRNIPCESITDGQLITLLSIEFFHYIVHTYYVRLQRFQKYVNLMHFTYKNIHVDIL